MESANLKEIIRKKIKEMSVTGGTASFTPGEGANYATPNAFNPNKKAKGAQNIYYYKLGFKPVNAPALHKKAKGIDHKDLWKKKLTEEKFDLDTYLNSLNIQDEKLKRFISNRVLGFDTIGNKLNELIPLIRSAKQKTINQYQQSPEFQVLYGTDIAESYLDDLITLFKD
jgi:hypothetical protein